MQVAVCGPRSCTEREARDATRIGRLLAERGAVVICGGGGGVMAAAAAGARSAGGTVIGVRPDIDPATASPDLSAVILTGMGEARNAIIVRSADAVIAVGGSWGTLSEVALAMHRGDIPVVTVGGWQLHDASGAPVDGPVAVTSPEDAVAAVMASLTASALLSEIVDVVDEDDRVVGQASRAEAYDRRLRHRCVFILVRDTAGRIFVHKRPDSKAVFPGCYDMFVGGVVRAGESYDGAALREAQEELGVAHLPPPRLRDRFRYENQDHAWWCASYEVCCDQPVHPPADEVAWHGFLTEQELRQRLAEWPWADDSRQAYQRLAG